MIRLVEPLSDEFRKLPQAKRWVALRKRIDASEFLVRLPANANDMADLAAMSLS